MNFDDFLLNVLHLSFIVKFDFVNINSICFRTHSLRIKLINVYDSNRKVHFYKYVNLRCVHD